MIDITQAIYNLYPNVVRTVDDVAYDKDGNEVNYDLSFVQAKAIELQAAEAQAEQAAAAAKQSALTKLTALGLTQAEITALIG